MISDGRQIAVYAFGEPVDMRKSFNTLSALVVELGREVLSGHFFLFREPRSKAREGAVFRRYGLVFAREAAGEGSLRRGLRAYETRRAADDTERAAALHRRQ